jgi:hypothetical protein
MAMNVDCKMFTTAFYGLAMAMIGGRRMVGAFE